MTLKTNKILTRNKLTISRVVMAELNVTPQSLDTKMQRTCIPTRTFLRLHAAMTVLPNSYTRSDNICNVENEINCR